MKISRIGNLIGRAWLMTGIALLLFGALEGTLSLFFHFKDHQGGPPAHGADQRVAADSYADASWVTDYYRELEQSADVRWESYVYWRRKPFHGSHINIDQNGVRLTTSPAQSSPPHTTEILMFGGSTLWGTGVRDAFTIPSCLARALRQREVACNVLNLGETGYVSTQEVIALMLRLREGHTPDLVIFYDGVNDTYSAWQQRAAGVPQNEFNRVREFNTASPTRLGTRVELLLRDTAERLATLRLLRGAGLKKAPDSVPSADTLVANSEALAQAVVDTYAANIELVRALSSRYGFRCLFYWQPTMFEKRHLTEYERSQREHGLLMEPFFRLTYDAVRKSRLAQNEDGFHDLSSMFDDVKEPVYLDWCHVGEPANEAIAMRMVDDVLRAIPSRR
jgi:hypothetical protein